MPVLEKFVQYAQMGDESIEEQQISNIVGEH